MYWMESGYDAKNYCKEIGFKIKNKSIMGMIDRFVSGNWTAERGNLCVHYEESEDTLVFFVKVIILHDGREDWSCIAKYHYDNAPYFRNQLEGLKYQMMEGFYEYLALPEDFYEFFDSNEID